MAEPAHGRVGGYRIIRKLAVGGMAEIFLARLEAGHGFTKQVVIKRLLPHLGEDPGFVDMFLHEARLAAGLSHPNIAQVFDIGESEGRLHYAMEYVHGPDLRAVAKRIHARWHAPPLDLVIGVCIGVAAGLHYAHTARDEAGRALSIIHRDVTPSNVVVTYGGVAKLLDFGVAKAKLEGRESTAVGVLKGKLPYMSPEQIECSAALDARSDVFSLGVMLWELTTLHRLFRCDSPIETMRRITREDAPPPSSVCEDYPPALAAIVARALARNRDNRYASAFELQRDLEVFARSHGLVVSGSRIAELMAELFAEELEEERALLEAEPREVTDSEVFTAHWADVEPEPEPDDDALTVISLVAPGPMSSMSGVSSRSGVSSSSGGPLSLAAASQAGLSQAGVSQAAASQALPTRARAWPWIASAAGGALVLALAWKAFGGAAPVEPASTTTSDTQLAPASQPSVPAPEQALPSAEPSVPVVPDVQVVPDVAEPEPEPTEPEPTPSKSKHKRTRPSSTSTTKPKTKWDKNSLALPE